MHVASPLFALSEFAQFKRYVLIQVFSSLFVIFIFGPKKSQDRIENSHGRKLLTGRTVDGSPEGLIDEISTWNQYFEGVTPEFGRCRSKEHCIFQM
jgi:hypothetical protein